VANIRYEFVLKALIESPQFLCRFERNNTLTTNDEEDRGTNVAHQPAIVGVGRGQDFESRYLGPQPRIGDELDDLRRTMRVPKPQLSKQVAPICAEKLAMLFDDIALVNLALPFRAYESRVGQDDAANGTRKSRAPSGDDAVSIGVWNSVKP